MTSFFPYMQSQCASLAAASGVPGLMLRKVPIDPNNIAINKKGRPRQRPESRRGAQTDAVGMKKTPLSGPVGRGGRYGAGSCPAVRGPKSYLRRLLSGDSSGGSRLQALGVQSGDLVTILSLNTPEAVIAFYAIDRIGAVANWVDMKLSPAEVEFYLTRAKSKVVLVFRTNFPKKYTPTVGMRRRNILWCFLWLPYLTPELGRKPVWASGKGRRDQNPQ